MDNQDNSDSTPRAAIERRQLRGAARRGSRRARRKRSRRIVLVLVPIMAAVAVIIGVGWFYYFHTGPEGGPVTVTIPTGASLTDVAAILQKKHVVPRARAFELRADSDGYSTAIKPGTYVLHVNEPYGQLIATLVAGPAQTLVRITIPEGFTLSQTAALVHSKLPRFSAAEYLDLTEKHPVTVNVPGYKPGHILEGLLFPATYEVPPTITPRAFIAEQLEAFSARLALVNMTRASKAHLTPYDVVIIASLIEREARAAADRPLIAAVIWNRLRLGMMLQIDATVIYALGTHKAVLTYQDLKVQSPYNTYLHFGLPPTPIANPGLASLQAAANPANVNYLFYVGRSDGTGPLYFSSTYSQFLKDEARLK